MGTPQSLFGGRFEYDNLTLSTETVKFEFQLKSCVFGILTL